AYAASKAFQSVYLDGLRDLARHSGLPIVITEVQPGFVDTAMMKPERPLGTIARFLLVVSPAVAARQIMKAVQRRPKHVYVPRRYGLLAFVAKLLPGPGGPASSLQNARSEDLRSELYDPLTVALRREFTSSGPVDRIRCNKRCIVHNDQPRLGPKHTIDKVR